MNISKLINEKLTPLINSSIVNVNLMANMIGISFSRDNYVFVMHIQAFTRIIHNNQIIVTSNDYFEYEKDDESGTRNDLWINMIKASEVINESKVIDVNSNDFGDFRIILDNKAIIEVMISNSMPNFDDEIEQYRFFQENSNDNHFVMYTNGNYDE